MPSRAENRHAATPAFPCVGRQNRCAPHARPSATPTARPRSLKLPEGLVPSFLRRPRRRAGGSAARAAPSACRRRPPRTPRGRRARAAAGRTARSRGRRAAPSGGRASSPRTLLEVVLDHHRLARRRAASAQADRRGETARRDLLAGVRTDQPRHVRVDAEFHLGVPLVSRHRAMIPVPASGALGRSSCWCYTWPTSDGGKGGTMAMLRVYVVSDATGETAERVVRSALTQFEGAPASIVRRGGVRTPEQVRAVVAEAALRDSIILHTLVSDDLRTVMLAECPLARGGRHGPARPRARPARHPPGALAAGEARAVPAVGRGARSRRDRGRRVRLPPRRRAARGRTRGAPRSSSSASRGR